MNKKRSTLIAVIAVVLVVALLSTLLVGCKKKPDPVSVEDAFSYVVSSYQNYGFDDAEKAALTTLKLEGDIALDGKTASDTENHKYNLNVKINLDLVNSYKTGNGNNFIDVTCKDNGTETFKFLYVNSAVEASDLKTLEDEDYLKYTPDIAYMKVNGKVYGLNVPNLAVSLRHEMHNAGIGINAKAGESYPGGSIEDELILSTINSDIVPILETAMSLLGASSPAMDKEAGTASFAIPLTDLLADGGTIGNALKEVADGVNPILTSLGLGNDVVALVNGIVPYINLNLSFTGLKAKPSMKLTAEVGKDGKIDMDIKTKGENGIYLDAPSCSGTLNMDLKLDKDAGTYVDLSADDLAAGNANLVNPLNLDINGTLKMYKDFKMSFKMNGAEKNVGIDAGTYKWNIAADINPSAMLGGRVDFTALNPNDIIEDVIGMLTTKPNLVEYLNISLTNTTTNELAFGVNIKKTKSGLQGYVKLFDILNAGKADNPIALSGIIDKVKDMINIDVNKFTQPDLKIDKQGVVTWKAVTNLDEKVVADSLSDYEIVLTTRTEGNDTTETLSADNAKLSYDATTKTFKYDKLEKSQKLEVKAKAKGSVPANDNYSSVKYKMTDTQKEKDDAAAKAKETKDGTLATVKQVLEALQLKIDLTKDSEKAEAKFDKTQFNAQDGDGKWDDLYVELTVGKILVNSDGLAITGLEIKNGYRKDPTRTDGTFDVKLDLTVDSIEFGTAGK